MCRLEIAMKEKKAMLRFLLKCILIPAAAVLIIYAINRPYAKINDLNYQDDIKYEFLGDLYTDIAIGNLGSSHGAYGFRYNDLEEKGIVCFNFGNVSQSYNYDYAILKEFSDDMADGSVMFIPVSYFSFNNEVVNAREAEAMSIHYYRLLSPRNIPDYDPYIDLVTHIFPVLSAGEDLLQLFPKLNTVLTARADYEGINVDEFIQNAQTRYDRHFGGKEEYFLPERIEELREIIIYCQEHNITPVLITTPFSKYYSELVSDEFLQEFYDTIHTIADDTQVNYYDYSRDPRFYENLELFSDPDHLTEDGALYFTDLLWDEIEELQRFH